MGGVVPRQIPLDATARNCCVWRPGVDVCGGSKRCSSCAPVVLCWLQECLGDAAPQVQALGLGCISLLCEADSLDFYKAWRVVQARFPSLPDHPNTAAAWVSPHWYCSSGAAPASTEMALPDRVTCKEPMLPMGL